MSTSLTSNSKLLPRDEQALPKLYSYLSNLAKGQDSGLQDIGVLGYSSLLRTKQSRELFWKQKTDTVDPLIETLTAAAGGKDSDSTLRSGGSSIRGGDSQVGGGVGLQLLYHVLLVIWQLSFEGKLVGNDLER